jgi:hypothetical protein
MARHPVDSAMIELALSDSLQRINDIVETIYKSQGWLESLADTAPSDNVTVWVGPRLAQIQDEVRKALS